MDKLGLLAQGARELGLILSEEQLDQFQRYYTELIAWNKKVNLTRITSWEDVQKKHFLDSLTIALVLQKPVPDGMRVIDIGSGAGFPGVPLKIAFPQMAMHLLESVYKKAQFLEYLVSALKLDKTRVIPQRAETLARNRAYRETFDIALARAVAPLSALMELALPFCRVGGRLVAQKDVSYLKEPGNVEYASKALGATLDHVLPIPIQNIGPERRLIVISKLTSTSDKYPRPPGIPTKRPL